MKSLPLSLALVVALAACTKPADTAPAQDAAPAATAIAAPAATVAQAAPADAAPAESVSAEGYTLTMAHVEAFLAAQAHIAAAVKADATLDPAMNASREDGLQFAARLEATPALRDAIAKAGLSTRDYALTNEALVAAMMAQGAIEAGMLKEVPAGLNPQNVEFVKAHKAELESKMQALQG